MDDNANCDAYVDEKDQGDDESSCGDAVAPSLEEGLSWAEGGDERRLGSRVRVGEGTVDRVTVRADSCLVE